MEKTREELIDYLENYNRHRLYTILDGELGRAIGQCLDIIKTIGWQPMETAPKDREFLGLYGATDGTQWKALDVFHFVEDGKYAFFNHGAANHPPPASLDLFAWAAAPEYQS